MRLCSPPDPFLARHANFPATFAHDVSDGSPVHEQPGNAERALERPPAVAPQVEHELISPGRLHFHEGFPELPSNDRVEVTQTRIADLVLPLLLLPHKRQNKNKSNE